MRAESVLPRNPCAGETIHSLPLCCFPCYLLLSFQSQSIPERLKCMALSPVPPVLRVSTLLLSSSRLIFQGNPSLNSLTTCLQPLLVPAVMPSLKLPAPHRPHFVHPTNARSNRSLHDLRWAAREVCEYHFILIFRRPSSFS